MFDYNLRREPGTNSHQVGNVSKNAPRSKAGFLSVQSNSDAGRYTLIHRHGAQRMLTALASIVLTALLITGCGGGGKKSASSTPGSNKGKTFAVLKAAWSAPDYLDPSQAYTVAAWQIFFNVYDGLVVYKHVAGPDGATIVPGLADSLPKVNSSGTQYTFTLRKGLKYSNGTPVKATDFRYAIERDFKDNSPGVGFYSNIVGVEGSNGYAKKHSGHIAGIVPDDAAGTITIKLVKPESDFLYVLALPFSNPVPQTTPNKLTQNPPPPSTGPYYIKSYKPNKSILVVRNPNWNNQIPTVPSGNPDELQAKIISDPSAAAQAVISGGADYDQSLLPSDRLAQLEAKYKDQIKLSPCACTWYFFMNQRLKPFNNLLAREAVNYGIDRNALLQFFGGLGQTTQNFLPPNYPQYKKISYYTYDMAKAKSLVQQSGMAGQSVKVYGENVDPSKSIVTYLTGQLNKMGFKATTRLLGQSSYFPTIGSQSTKAQIGYLDWLQDFPYPTDWFDVLLNGENIHETGNNNDGNVDIKPLNAEIDRLKHLPPAEVNSPKTNHDWAKLDYDYSVRTASVANYVNRTETDFFSPRMDLSCYYFHVVANFDWGTICTK
jgi:peptide/nickel transport system substrate-binding protein